jgi:alpha-galactosidase
MPKIALIGAGSVIFAKTLICDILQNPALADATLSRMDIDPERLRVSRILTERVVAQLGGKARVEATTDLRDACRGARYAITMIQVGGYRPGTVLDFEIPRKYGLLQTIGDTLGVGGIFRALRTIPELSKVARAMQEVGAPDPLLINYTNPMAMCMMGLSRATGIKSVGLCHSVQGTSRQLALYAGVPYEEVDFLVAGINHMAFFLKFRYRKQNAYPLLFKALEEPSIFSRDRVRFEMMRRLGYFVTESSEHFSEYCPHFLPHGDSVIQEFNIPIDEYLRRCESILVTWQDTERQMLASDQPVEITRSVEYGAAIINSMESNESSVIYGNVPNTGLITNLPSSACVEVPCLVDAQGLQPTVIGDLPPQLAAIIRSNVSVQELAVEACLSGKREHIYHAVMADPHTAAQLTLDAIWRMTDELIEAHQREGLLGSFFPTAPGSGRSAEDLGRVLIRFEEDFGSPETNDTIRLRAVLQNQLSRKFTGPVSFQIEDGPFEISAGSPAEIDLAPGESLSLNLRVKRLSGDSATLTLGVCDAPPEVLSVAFVRPPRVSYPLLNSSAPVPVHLEFSGNAVADGTLVCEEDKLILDLRVNDTNPVCNPTSFWASSAIELFFLDAGRADARIEHWIAIPDVHAPQLFRKGHHGDAPPAGHEFVVEGQTSGYELRLSLPLDGTGVRPHQPFLFEFSVRVNALGDAHGYTVQSWRGSSRPAQDSAGFALIC